MRTRHMSAPECARSRQDAPLGGAHFCTFPDDMPLEMQRQLIEDVHDHAWFDVKLRIDLEEIDGEHRYERVGPDIEEAWEFAHTAVESVIDKQLWLDHKLRGDS